MVLGENVFILKRYMMVHKNAMMSKTLFKWFK